MSEKKPTPGELRRRKATAKRASLESETQPEVKAVEPPADSPAVPEPVRKTLQTRYPAIALLEYSSVTAGIFCADAMIKKAPIKVIKSGTVHNGKFLVLIGGSVGAVEEAYSTGLDASGRTALVDHVILPRVANQVHDAVLGARKTCQPSALGIMETFTSAATIKSTDAGVKGAVVDLIELRLSDDLGGKAFAIFNGDLFEVEAAMRIAREACTSENNWLRETIIPNLHPEMAQQVDNTTYFSKARLDKLAESE